MRDIGKNIRDLRTRKNMTQDTLAEKLFVTRQTVSNYETGKSRPDIDMLMRIADTLGADIHHLLYGSQPPEDQTNKVRLAIGGGLTAFLGILCLTLAPWFKEIRYKYLLAGTAYIQHLFLYPLFFLLLGWTVAHLLGMALKRKPIRNKWARAAKWLLLTFLIFYFFVAVSFLIPFLVGEYQFMTATGDRSLADYLHIPAYAEFLFNKILFPKIFSNLPSAFRIFPLIQGALLWLLDFPSSKDRE